MTDNLENRTVALATENPRSFEAELAPWQENNVKVLNSYGALLHIEKPSILIYKGDKPIPPTWLKNERIILPPDVLSKKFEDAIFDYLKMYTLKQYHSLSADSSPMEVVRRLIQAPIVYNGLIKSLSEDWQKAPPKY